MAKRKKTKRGASTGAAVPKRGRKKASKTVSAEEKALARARHLRDTFRAHFAPVQKFDAKRPKKLLPKAALDAFDGLIHDTSTAMTAHPVAMKKTDRARAVTAKQRAVVRDHVIEIRDLMIAQYPDDGNVAGAYAGAGFRIDAGTTQDVIAAASKQEQAYASEDFGPQGRQAGLTPAQIAKLIAQRRALEKLASALVATEKAQTSAARNKASFLKTLRTRTGQLEKIARVIFKGLRDILDEFFGAPKRRKRRAGKGGAGKSGGGGPTAGGGAPGSA